MSDEQTPRSGSRWEPAPDDETVVQPPAPPVPPAATASSPSTPTPATSAPATSAASGRSWTERVRSNGGLVGGALALVVVGGLGGLAVGHAAAGPDRVGIVGERLPGGFPPPAADGQLPPPPHGDDDGHGLGVPGGSDDGPGDGGSDDGAEQGSTL